MCNRYATLPSASIKAVALAGRRSVVRAGQFFPARAQIALKKFQARYLPDL
jgi:hypothetical protein